MVEFNGMMLDIPIPVEFPNKQVNQSPNPKPSLKPGSTASERTTPYNPVLSADRYAENREEIAERYSYEKLIGKRNTDGSLKLKELKPEHLQMVSMSIQGWKGVDIAEFFSVSAITVYRVLNDPLAKSIIDEFEENFKNEFQAMLPLVNEAVRDGLQSGSTESRLKAVDRFVKVSRYVNGEETENKESKIEAIYAARARFVDMVKSAAKTIEGTGGEIEIEATLVESH